MPFRIVKTRKIKGISLVEIMVALTILSALVLPGFIFIIDLTRGGNDIAKRHEILSLIEEKLELAIAMPFNELPEGKNADTIIESKNGNKLDLTSQQIGNYKVSFDCFVESYPTEFTVMKDYKTRKLQKVKLDYAIKKITITARWGQGAKAQNLDLMAYKSDI